jgi:alpha-1,3-rhamnosyl/mannosyltransferase
MLRAIAEARRTTDVEFVWAGKFTARDLKKLRAYLRSEGVLDELPTVRFVGYVSSEDLAVLYRNALAHLFVSRLEGFGISVAEAMASGCPVIVANGSGADEVGGDAVMKIDPGDHAAAARAIGRLANDPTERVRLTAAGLSRARVFDRATMARGYVNVWRQVK